MRGIRELANKDSGNNPIRREDLFLASGGTDRSQKGMEQRLRDALAYSGGDYLDLFVLEYVCPEEAGDDSGDLVKALELARSWVRDGSVRYVGASTHSHSVGAWLGSLDRGEERDNDNDNDGASSPLPLLDAMMLRYNMGHKAAAEALSLPVCAERGIPVLAFTTTRWNRLQDGHPDWGQRAPTTPECLSFALSASSDERGASAGPDAPTTTEDGAGRPIEIVLHSARDAEELGEGMSCLDSSFVPPTIDAGNRAAVAIWRDYGDLEWNDMDGFDEYPEEQQGTSIL
ncbi:unnamed protein product [Pseudo-nitzschia multistriata]|uniref:Uncharacterized protein n=1 Tax=Pseudo-nitzschia multistriata TaxID=183589 RepID=A0A448ZG64_9STRA|nr:unnamed protein product [Pseudo-nitzschia multistriata]